MHLNNFKLAYHYFVILLFLGRFGPSSGSDMPNFLSNFITEHFYSCQLWMIYGDFLTGKTAEKTLWQDIYNQFVSSSKIVSGSSGVLNVNLKSNQKEFFPLEKLPRTISDTCQVVIIFLPVGIPDETHDQILHQRVNTPLLNPPSVRNMDKFFFVTPASKAQSLYKYEFVQNIKYKLVITQEVNDIFQLRQWCVHCSPQETIIEIRSPPLELMSTNSPLLVQDYFPDFQRNYRGYVRKVSSTDKMDGDLEFGRDSKTGKDYPKRGVFASALLHLAEGMNFTADLFRSENGATGHTLPNGTWVGSIGDVLNGAASFCMLCGASYPRHFVVEICSPVTYEDVRFAIGPSAKLYTWKAIFWPFDARLWIAMAFSTFLVVISSYILLKCLRQSNWSLPSMTQYYVRLFIEQADEPPVGLSQSVRVIIGFWLLFALIGTTLYRAKMVTFMTFPVFESAPSTYEELARSNYQIEFHYFPNIAYNSFKSSTNPTIVNVFQKMLKQPDPVACLQNTMKSKSVCIMFSSVHEDLINRNMSDKFGQSPIRKSINYAFMFTPGISAVKLADFTPNFKRILSTSLQMGLNQWWQTSNSAQLLKAKNGWIKSLPPANLSSTFQLVDDSDDVLHLKHLKGAFTVLIGGLTCASIAFSGEMLRNMQRKATLTKLKVIRIWTTHKIKPNNSFQDETLFRIQRILGKTEVDLL